MYKIAILSFLLVVLVLNQLSLLLTKRQRKIASRLKSTMGSQTTISKIPKTVVPRKEVANWLQSVSMLGTLTSRKYRQKIQQELIKAGIPMKAEEMVSLSIIFAAVAAAFGVLVFKNFILALVLGALFFILPIIVVKNVKSRRTQKIEGQLLDTLVLMANSLRAGNSFMQSLELASREAPAPLSTEFAQVIRETRLGTAVEQSLVSLNNRMESKEMELAVTGVLIQRQVGGNLAEILDSIAETIENRVKTKAKIRTLTAQGRLSAWIVSLLPLGLAAFIFGMYPDFGRIMLEEPIGIVMLSGGAFMLIIGILVIRKVVNIDV